MRILDLALREVFDSRGASTVEAAVRTERGSFAASVPAGASKGGREVAALPFAEASRVFEERVRPALADIEVGSIREVDSALRRLDETPGKRVVGGNVMLAVSIAVARALSAERGAAVWEALRAEFFSGVTAAPHPVIFSNLINGGAHAKNNLDIQEYMVAVETEGEAHARVAQLVGLYRELGRVLSAGEDHGAVPLGDEAGYATFFTDNAAPLSLLDRLLQASPLLGHAFFALDAAADQFAEGEKYRFGGELLSREALRDVYLDWQKRFPLFRSIEDPFYENDAEGFSALRAATPDLLVVGDDFTTTDPARIAAAADKDLITGVIIKPNQIGLVSEACDAIRAGHERGIKCIVSHRSGETEDTFIIHLAKAAGVYGLKIGAPARERMVKFNEFLRLYG